MRKPAKHRSASGATAVEYVLIACAIVLVLVAAMPVISEFMHGGFSHSPPPVTIGT